MEQHTPVFTMNHEPNHDLLSTLPNFSINKI